MTDIEGCRVDDCRENDHWLNLNGEDYCMEYDCSKAYNRVDY